MPGMLRDFVTVQIFTDDGIEGIGFTTFGGRIVNVLKAAVEALGELIKGEDPLRTEAVTAKIRAASAAAGPGGLRTLAMAAVTLRSRKSAAKRFGVPLAQLLRRRAQQGVRPMPAARWCAPRRLPRWKRPPPRW